jgi:DNA-binding MarR family transcriptional regulator
MGNLDAMKRRTPDAEWLDHMINMLQEFRKLHADATLNQVISYLAIAREENITQSEVLKLLDMKTSGQSRIISMLSKYGDRNVPGWDVIRQDENPFDRRQKLLSLSGRGKLILNTVRDSARAICRSLDRNQQQGVSA